MKKIYYIYAIIPENIYDKKVRYIIPNQHDYKLKHNAMYGLYAWSTSKKIVKEFFEVRNKSVYTLIKKDIYDKEDYKLIKEKYGDLELDYRKFYYNNDSPDEEESITIVSTKNEYVQSTEYISENLYEFGPKADIAIHYSIFKDKIIKALDLLGYTTDYDIEYGNDSDADYASYNLSFGLTKYGNRNVTGNVNQMNILLFLFRYLFYGNESTLKEDES